MHFGTKRGMWLRMSALVGGSAYILSGCDAGVRTTVEDGIINLSTALLGSFLQAIVELAQEDTTTAMLGDTLTRVLA